jgi:hypothetical protein
VKATYGTGVFVLGHAGDRRPTPASGLLPTDADAVIVSTGSDWGVDDHTWLAIFRDITDQLAAGTAAAGSALGCDCRALRRRDNKRGRVAGSC